MDYTERIEQQRREDELKDHWFDVVSLLSLDLTSYFVEELGLSCIYSPDLQQAARNLFPSFEDETIFDKWLAVVTDAVPERFLESIAVNCGSDIASALQEWSDMAFPPENQSHLYGFWDYVFIDFVRLWDKKVLGAETPFGKLDETHLRLRVRNYVQHYENMQKEINLITTTQYSEWDKQTNEIHELDDYSDVIVSTTRDNYQAWLFWRSLTSLLNREQIDRLISWAGEHQDVSDAGIKTIAIPSFEY